MKLVFLIQKPSDICEQTGEPTGEPLFWSNLDGWGPKEMADRFTSEQANETPLPAGGIWDYMMVWQTIEFPQQ